MSLLAAAARGEYFVNLYQNLGNYHLQHIFCYKIYHVFQVEQIVVDETRLKFNSADLSGSGCKLINKCELWHILNTHYKMWELSNISEALVLVSDQTIVSSNAIRTGIGLRFHQN